MFSKKGLSQVISTVLLIALVLFAIGLVWGILTTFTETKLQSAQNCNDVLGSLKFDPEYTCYESGAVYISIARGDFDLDSIYLSVEYQGSNAVFEMDETAKTVSGIELYGGGGIIMPDKEGSKTYTIYLPGRPGLIEVAPMAGGTLCDYTDSMSNIADC